MSLVIHRTKPPFVRVFVANSTESRFGTLCIAQSLPADKPKYLGNRLLEFRVRYALLAEDLFHRLAHRRCNSTCGVEALCAGESDRARYVLVRHAVNQVHAQNGVIMFAAAIDKLSLHTRIRLIHNRQSPRTIKRGGRVLACILSSAELCWTVSGHAPTLARYISAHAAAVKAHGIHEPPAKGHPATTPARKERVISHGADIETRDQLITLARVTQTTRGDIRAERLRVPLHHMTTQCGASSVSARNAGEITSNGGALAVFGNGELRIDPSGVGAWEVVHRQGATG